MVRIWNTKIDRLMAEDERVGIYDTTREGSGKEEWVTVKVC